MRYQIAFRLYNPKKFHHCGLLFKLLNDACYPYTYKSAPYALKPGSGNRRSQILYYEKDNTDIGTTSYTVGTKSKG